MTRILFCYDGSEGSASALASTRGLVAQPADAVVLTVWRPLVSLLALSGSLSGTLPTDPEPDESEERHAHVIADEGAVRAREHGFRASSRVEAANEGTAWTILQVADEIGASLIVSGRRGRGAVRTAMLGSVSHELLRHTKIPILIAPVGDGHEPDPSPTK